MSNLSSTLSQYQFTDNQAKAIASPLGQYFAEQDVLYSRDNASLKAHYGTSNEEQITYDAANRQFFNDTLELGLDCGRANTAAGRPDQSNVTGSSCYPPSISTAKAARQMDANYNEYQPSAEQVVLAEGDIRYAPARFVDQNNFASPSISDFTFQPRLMGTRDYVSTGCTVDTEGGLSTCALKDDPLPYQTVDDPRTSWGVDEPRSQYWDSLGDGPMMSPGCMSTNGGQYPDNWSEMCGLSSVEPGPRRPVAPQYALSAVQ